MLILSRKAEEGITIGGDIFIKVVRIEVNPRDPAKSRAVIGIKAPESIRILRSELEWRGTPVDSSSAEAGADP